MSDYINQSLDQAKFNLIQSQADSAMSRARMAHHKEPDQPAVPGSEAALQNEKTEEAAKGFDAVFFRMLIKEMRKTVEKTGLMGENSSSMKMYEDLLDEKLAESMADKHGIGVGDMVRDHLKEQQATTFDAYSEEVQKHMKEQAEKIDKLKIEALKIED